MQLAIKPLSLGVDTLVLNVRYADKQFQRIKQVRYFLDHVVDFPLFSNLDHLDHERLRRPNNRAPGWNGVFTFVFIWQQVDTEAQKNILETHCKTSVVARLLQERLHING